MLTKKNLITVADEIWKSAIAVEKWYVGNLDILAISTKGMFKKCIPDN